MAQILHSACLHSNRPETSHLVVWNQKKFSPLIWMFLGIRTKGELTITLKLFPISRYILDKQYYLWYMGKY